MAHYTEAASDRRQPSSGSTAAGWLTTNRYAVLLAAIVATAVLLRLYRLGDWSFWGDEMFTLGGREDGFNYSVWRQSLSLALIQGVTAWRGVSEWHARIVPALFGVLTVPTLAYFVRRIANPAAGLLAALLLAVSPWHLYWSQNARFYTALLLFYSVAAFLFYLGLETDRPWYFVLSLGFFALAAKERLLALFLLPIILIYLLLLWRLPFAKPPGLRLRNLLIFFAPGLPPGLLLVLPYLRNLSGWLDGFGYANNSPIWLLAAFGYYVGLPLLGLAAVGGAFALRQRSRAGLFCILCALLPPLALAAVAPVHYTATRYAFVALPAWIVLASTAVTALLPKKSDASPFLTAGLLLLLLLPPLGDVLLYYQVQNGNRDDWKAAFSYVQAHRTAADLVAAANPDLGSYYLQDAAVGFEDLDLAQIAQGTRTVWFVEDAVAREIHPDIHGWLERHAVLTAVYDVHFQARTFTMRVYRYRPDVP